VTATRGGTDQWGESAVLTRKWRMKEVRNTLSG